MTFDEILNESLWDKEDSEREKLADEQIKIIKKLRVKQRKNGTIYGNPIVFCDTKRDFKFCNKHFSMKYNLNNIKSTLKEWFRTHVTFEKVYLSANNQIIIMFKGY